MSFLGSVKGMVVFVTGGASGNFLSSNVDSN